MGGVRVHGGEWVNGSEWGMPGEKSEWFCLEGVLQRDGFQFLPESSRRRNRHFQAILERFPEEKKYFGQAGSHGAELNFHLISIGFEWILRSNTRIHEVLRCSAAKRFV